jgi:hypothetical protein
MRLKQVIATFKIGDIITRFMNCVQQKFYDVSCVDPTKIVSTWMLRTSCLSLSNTGSKNMPSCEAIFFRGLNVDDQWSFIYM